MENLEKLSILELQKAISDKKISCKEIVKYFFNRIENAKKLNAVLETFPDALEIAEVYDEDIKNGINLKPFAGIPMLIKDNILIEGKTASCASNFLKNFVAPYSATVIKKLQEQGFIFLGRTNMDEFAMGSSTETSAYGPCFNALGDNLVPGGSSGGSATAVAAGLCLASLGTDTGGSVRQPASFQGIVGSKPTYGRVSRFGVVAFASSIEQVGVFSKNVEDNEIILNIISGFDINDSTSQQKEISSTSENIDLKTMKVGIFNEVYEALDKLENKQVIYNAIEMIKQAGAEIVNLPFEHFALCPATYYVIAPAEAASNLGRFDGIKYSTRAKEATSVNDIYAMSRTQGFGKEVKRRIMLGNFVLSSAFYDAYYIKAKRMQQALSNEMQESFKSCDFIISPTTSGEAFKIGEKINDPISMWCEDLFTICANITGVPALSIPCGKGKNNLPIGLQVMTNKFQESKLFGISKKLEEIFKEATK